MTRLGTHFKGLLSGILVSYRPLARFPAWLPTLSKVEPWSRHCRPFIILLAKAPRAPTAETRARTATRGQQNLHKPLTPSLAVSSHTQRVTMALTRLLAAAAAAGLAAAQTSYAPATTSRLLAGQRQCQTLGRCGGVDPASSMIDPTIKLLLVSSPKAGATLVERLMLAALNLTGDMLDRGGASSSGTTSFYLMW